MATDFRVTHNTGETESRLEEERTDDQGGHSQGSSSEAMSGCSGILLPLRAEQRGLVYCFHGSRGSTLSGAQATHSILSHKPALLTSSPPRPHHSSLPTATQPHVLALWMAPSYSQPAPLGPLQTVTFTPLPPRPAPAPPQPGPSPSLWQEPPPWAPASVCTLGPATLSDRAPRGAALPSGFLITLVRKP